jgi:hypothetical protein
MKGFWKRRADASDSAETILGGSRHGSSDGILDLPGKSMSLNVGQRLTMTWSRTLIAIVFVGLWLAAPPIKQA